MLPFEVDVAPYCARTAYLWGTDRPVAEMAIFMQSAVELPSSRGSGFLHQFNLPIGLRECRKCADDVLDQCYMWHRESHARRLSR